MQLRDEQRQLVDVVRKIAHDQLEPRAIEVANSHEFPWDWWDILKRNQLIGLYFPEQWGGSGVDLATLCLVVEELARVSNTAASMLIGQVFGGLPIMEAGTPEQQQSYLPRAVSGDALVAMAMTEPVGGSDVAAIQTRAVLDGETYVINGSKCFISNANIADVITVYAKTTPPKGARGISAFLVDRGTPGFAVTRLEDKMGSTAIPTCEIVFEDCRVPVTRRLGAEDEAFRLAMRVFGKVRPSIGARSVGVAQGALDAAVQYARERRAFGKPIGAYQGISFLIADMATRIEAARGLVWRACEAVDEGDPNYDRYCSMAKLYASDVAMQVTTDALQIFGGYGYLREYPVEHRMREAKLAQIVEGTNQIQRIVIARSLLGRLD